MYNVTSACIDTPGSGKVLVYWLGAAGFLFKFEGGESICIDPYLSDAVERDFGYRRLSVPPMEAADLRTDVLLFTHEHGDHVDVDSYDAIMSANPGCRVLAPKSCCEYLDEKPYPYDAVSPGTITQIRNVTVRTVAADHGADTPNAVGYVIEFAGRKIYFTGDTCYNEAMMAPVIAEQPEIVIPCINGAFGNLSEFDGAKLTAACNARIAIPSHFWLFAEHGGDPGKFRAHVTELSDAQTILLTPGRGVEI